MNFGHSSRYRRVSVARIPAADLLRDVRVFRNFGFSAAAMVSFVLRRPVRIHLSGATVRAADPKLHSDKYETAVDAPGLVLVLVFPLSGFLKD